METVRERKAVKLKSDCEKKTDKTTHRGKFTKGKQRSNKPTHPAWEASRDKKARERHPPENQGKQNKTHPRVGTQASLNKNKTARKNGSKRTTRLAYELGGCDACGLGDAAYAPAGVVPIPENPGLSGGCCEVKNAGPASLP